MLAIVDSRDVFCVCIVYTLYAITVVVLYSMMYDAMRDIHSQSRGDGVAFPSFIRLQVTQSHYRYCTVLE